MSDDLFRGAEASATFERARAAAVDIIGSQLDLGQAALTVPALLEPLDPDEQRVYLAGLLASLAVDAFARADTIEQLIDMLHQVTFVGGMGWAVMHPEKWRQESEDADA